MIALLCSVAAEAKPVLAKTAVTKTTVLGSTSIMEGTLADQQVLLCAGGMGKVNAAHAATLLLSQFSVKALLIFGVGGAYPSTGAKVGDLAVAREEISADEGVLTLDGFKDTEYIGIPLIKTASSVIHTTFPASEALLDHSLKAISSGRAIEKDRVHVGPFLTLSTCTGTSARARELEDRYHGLCENMEGAAAAQVAALHGIPWLEVRGISNLVEDRDLTKWDLRQAADICQKAVVKILESWE